VHLHANAKLTPSNRRLLVARVLDEHWKVADVAVAFGISERTAYRWLARWRAGDQRLSDRSSAPRRVPRRTPRPVEALIEQLRRLRMTSSRIAAELKMAVSTVCAVLARLGLNLLSRLEPAEPPNRYERRRPGELLHLDVKKLGRFHRPGHRVRGRGAPGVFAGPSAGWECVHVAVDDFTRMAYVEILNDERGATCAEFLDRAVTWFAQRGVPVERVMTDNGAGYIAKVFAATCTQRQIRHLRTRPYRPRTNGKGERFIQTLLRDWAYAATYRSSDHRALALTPWIDYYTRRPRSPSTGLAAHHRLTNVAGNYS
jgi:transposase InsO family protein